MGYNHIKITCTHVHRYIDDAAHKFKDAKLVDTKVKFDTYRAGINTQSQIEISIEATEGEIIKILEYFTKRRTGCFSSINVDATDEDKEDEASK